HGFSPQRDHSRKRWHALKINKMKKILVIVCFSFCSYSFGQEFSFELFFEDSEGNQDSIVLGYDQNATDDIDSAFGEDNIISVPYNSGLDVRVTDEQKALTNFPNPIPATYHTKTQIIQKNCPTSFSVLAIDIVTENWPVTITWNSTLFNDICRNGSVFTSINPGGWWDTGSPSEFECGFYRVILLNENQTVFCDNTDYPEFPTNDNYSYLTDDNKAVSVFWFTFGNEDILLNIEDHVLSNVKAYPNPTDDKLWFDINKTDLESDKVELMDINGKGVKIKLNDDNSISIENLENGIYFLKLKFKNGSVLLKKIIKN
ncbi:MAG: T9SS type A sorting domain-containing protein, partial [Mangrovimonas sp.]|nr:T9SS type A sorting domain-containing protein [Mangrovimonas sp.]